MTSIERMKTLAQLLNNNWDTATASYANYRKCPEVSEFSSLLTEHMDTTGDSPDDVMALLGLDYDSETIAELITNAEPERNY